MGNGTNARTHQHTSEHEHKIIVMLFKRDFGFLSHVSHPFHNNTGTK
jgi:hypothetical protein